jgi:hypothetical protein
VTSKIYVKKLTLAELRTLVKAKKFFELDEVTIKAVKGEIDWLEYQQEKRDNEANAHCTKRRML